MHQASQNAASQDTETALQTCRDLQHLAKSASANGGTVPNGVKIISTLLVTHVNVPEVVQVAVASLSTVLTGVPHAPALARLEGGVKASVVVLQTHCDRAKIVAPILKLLAKLCSSSAMTAVAFVKEKRSLESLLRTINTHLADHTVVAPGCDLLVGLSRHDKSAKLLPASEVVSVLRDVLVGYLGRWDVCSSSLRVLKNLAKCEDARLTLLRSTECTKLLLGVSRILARLPERRKLFKRAYRTLWVLFQGLLPPLPGSEMRPDVTEESADQPLCDEDIERKLFPESNSTAGIPEPDVYSPEDSHISRLHATVVPPSELPDAPTAERSGENTQAEMFHSDGDVLVARAMLHELERILHPSRVRNDLVYDDFEGPLVPHAPPSSSSSSTASSRAASAAGSRPHTPRLWDTDSVPSTPDLDLSERAAARTQRQPSYGRRAVASTAAAAERGAAGASTNGATNGSTGSGDADPGRGHPGRPMGQGKARGQMNEMAVAALATATALEGRGRIPPALKAGSGAADAGASVSGSSVPMGDTPPLIFESRFESGNLRRAVRVYDREYDLQLAPDANDTDGRCQWFFLSVAAAVPGLPYKFNVVNLGKKDSLYNAGMRPLLCCSETADQFPINGSSHSCSTGSWREWIRAGEDVCYYPAPYRSAPSHGKNAGPSKGGAGSRRRTRGSAVSVKGLGAGVRSTEENEGQTNGKAQAASGKEAAPRGVGSGLYGVTFTLQLETSGLHYLAMCYPYTYSDLQKYISSMLNSRLLTPTSSQSISDICRRSLLCRTLKGHRVDALTITDFPSLCQPDHADGPSEGLVGPERPYVVITARVHPGETNASWMMNGILEYLLGPSETAERLRQTYVFKCIPMLNPDGVINGSYRCSLAGVDLNRCWGNPNRKRHPSIYYCKRMIDRIARSGRLVLFCDLHGHSRKEDVFVYGCEPLRGRDVDRDCVDPRDEAEARARVRLLPFLISRQNPAFKLPKCSFKVSRSKLGTGRVVVCRELGVPNSYTIEASLAGCSSTGRHLTACDFKEVGFAFCRALADATDAIEGGPESEMDLLQDIDAACGLGLVQLSAGGGRDGANRDENADSDESGEEE